MVGTSSSGVGKGKTNNPNGRRKGVANKTTIQAREAVAKFVDGNIGRLNNWLDRIAEDSPKDAFNCLMSVVEYHIPKLARTDAKVEHSVDDKLAKILQDMDGRSTSIPTKD